ncbi:PREDICTED: uncharacterized protein LOC106109898 isoform X2 [Papilio polytes]|uniref:uncharacterized protein LOC106109898 isoform X2 n=1 Tax=Papilio polytes TaxID=76194 RepID=UPI0006769E79|nr:PREDICTED: uncharacterized protein LOC106109898 isoform X2 [Papilio polytes]
MGVAVFVGAGTVYRCVWAPAAGMRDYDKLARIMYLYDSEACGRRVAAALAIANLRLSNATGPRGVRPVRWRPALATVSASLSAATRWYLNFSVAIHALWLLSALLVNILVKARARLRFQKIGLSLFFYASISVVIFDLSMAIVYASHIKKSLTKGMILRYSGWSVEMKLENYTAWGGWVPLAAALCWTRGGLIECLNVYCCRAVHLALRGVRKREVKRRLTLALNPPLPEARSENPSDGTVLYFRAGEYIPFRENRVGGRF